MRMTREDGASHCSETRKSGKLERTLDRGSPRIGSDRSTARLSDAPDEGLRTATALSAAGRVDQARAAPNIKPRRAPIDGVSPTSPRARAYQLIRDGGSMSDRDLSPAPPAERHARACRQGGALARRRRWPWRAGGLRAWAALVQPGYRPVRHADRRRQPRDAVTAKKGTEWDIRGRPAGRSPIRGSAADDGRATLPVAPTDRFIGPSLDSAPAAAMTSGLSAGRGISQRMSTAFVFPGQGSQAVGMGADAGRGLPGRARGVRGGRRGAEAAAVAADVRGAGVAS